MRASRFELAVGESVRVDDQILTVIDISGDEITFRLDYADEHEAENVVCVEELAKRFPPR